MRRLLVVFGSLLPLLALALLWVGRDKLLTVDPMLEGEAVTAVAMIEQKAGHNLRATDLRINHHDIRAEIQNGTRPDVADRWTYGHWRGWRGLIDWHFVTGPTAMDTARDTPVAQRVFEVKDVDFSAVPRLAAEAIARVALEDAASVTEMSLLRPRIMGLQQRIGTVRWRIEVSSGHESAAAFANAAGRMTGADLSGTLRAQRYNLFTDNQALLEAVRAFRSAFDGKERVRQGIVSAKGIRFEVPLANEPGRTEWWAADISGAHRESFQSPVALPIGLPLGQPEQPFSTADVAWDALPRLQQTARERLEMPAGEVTMLDLKRDTGSFGANAPVFTFSLRDGKGDEGGITLDASGTARAITWPMGRAAQKQVNMLQGESMAAFLAALRGTFAPGNAVMELVFRPDEAIAVVRDPSKPRSLLHVHDKGFGLERGFAPEDPPGTFQGERYDESWLFDLGAIRPEVLAALPALQVTALQRLAIKGGTVTAIGIGRHVSLMPRVHDLNIEISVQGDDRLNGRYFADLQGHVLRVESP